MEKQLREALERIEYLEFKLGRKEANIKAMIKLQTELVNKKNEEIKVLNKEINRLKE